MCKGINNLPVGDGAKRTLTGLISASFIINLALVLLAVLDPAFLICPWFKYIREDNDIWRNAVHDRDIRAVTVMDNIR